MLQLPIPSNIHIKNIIRYDLLGENSGIVTKEQLNLIVKRKEGRKKRISTEKLGREEGKKIKLIDFIKRDIINHLWATLLSNLLRESIIRNFTTSIN